LTQAINFDGRRGGVEDASGKRVGKSPFDGVDAPLGPVVRIDVKEERIPERIATPIVPQPMTASVRDSEAGSMVD
jgi:hypothetical protein